jgi:hypothetical protein
MSHNARSTTATENDEPQRKSSPLPPQIATLPLRIDEPQCKKHHTDNDGTAQKVLNNQAKGRRPQKITENREQLNQKSNIQLLKEPSLLPESKSESTKNCSRRQS